MIKLTMDQFLLIKSRWPDPYAVELLNDINAILLLWGLQFLVIKQKFMDQNMLVMLCIFDSGRRDKRDKGNVDLLFVADAVISRNSKSATVEWEVTKSRFGTRFKHHALKEVLNKLQKERT